MNKREAKFTTKLQKWIVKNWDITGPIEVKVSTGHRIGRSQFSEHQIRALNLAKNSKVVWKIPDLGMLNLFDVVFYAKTPAFVCLVFFVETDKEVFYMVDIDTFNKEMGTSIAESRCREISTPLYLKKRS